MPWLAGLSAPDQAILGGLPPGAIPLFPNPAPGYPAADVSSSNVRRLPALASPGTRANPDDVYAAIGTAQ